MDGLQVLARTSFRDETCVGLDYPKMEGLRALARPSFDDELPGDSKPGFDTISISTFSTQPAIYQKEKLSEEGVKTFVTRPALLSKQNEKADATFQLVCIPRSDKEELCVSPETFHFIFESFQLDANILYLISKNSYGFHHFQNDHNLTSSGDSATHCFFIGTVIQVLIWSFDPKTMATKAIALPRIQSDPAAFRTFGIILTLYKDHIHTPCLLVLVAVIQTIRSLDDSVMEQLYTIREVEAYTGHGSWINSGSIPDDPEVVLIEINYRSRSVGNCLVRIANQQRHVEIVRLLLKFLRDPQADSYDYRGEIDNNDLSRHDTALATLQSTLPVLARQLKNTTEYNLYLQERARNQSSVLFGLMTHQDALISSRLASSSTEIAAAAKKDGEAMKELAAATKKDSSAMKTIAVMTMVFLPATFYAALFSVPSLQWDKRPVIQDGFGTYWAFTVPTTVIVFLVWLVLTNWSVICRTLVKLIVEREDEGIQETFRSLKQSISSVRSI